jgi:hypothetical protein
MSDTPQQGHVSWSPDYQSKSASELAIGTTPPIGDWVPTAALRARLATARTLIEQLWHHDVSPELTAEARQWLEGKP